MLRVTVTNDKQRRELLHDAGPLLFGRAPRETGDSCTIEDQYVSREQIQIEEQDGSRMRLENVGRNQIVLADGTIVPPGDIKQVNLPIRLTVGQTVLDVAVESARVATETIGQTLFLSTLSGLPDLILENVSAHYPYPLAYGYRLLGGITNPVELYREQLRTAENLLAFLGSVSLALAANETDEPLEQYLGRPLFDYWRGGISPGNWLDIIIYVAERLRKDGGSALSRSMAGLNINKAQKGLGKILRGLIKAKNDHKHDRGPSVDEEYRQQSVAVSEDLRSAFNSVSFLISHPILLIQDMNPRRRSDKADVLFLKCMGDHPGFKSEKSEHSATLRKGDIYIQVDEGKLAPLYPFLCARMCRQCKTREFFFIDRIDKGKASDAGSLYSAGLKSFERGHSDTDGDAGDEAHEILAGG